ncbi:MAG: hypothetical protein ACK553_10330 [Planctomycetota bacterium]
MPDPIASNPPDRDAPAFLERLISLFYREPQQLGIFALVDSNRLAEPYRGLLAHDRHMTVTVESFCRDTVDVQVLRSRTHGEDYSREILLRTQQVGQVVQYGIVRLHLHRIADGPKREILQEKKPLGRVLIEHQVLREVELLELWQVFCGPVLSELFSVSQDTVTYGRTAMIHCNGEPAIELLEIVRPAPSISYP